MYKIIMNCWYQENGGCNQTEPLPKEFKHISDAAKYLGDNIEQILDDYPVESFKIEYVSKPKPKDFSSYNHGLAC